MLACRYTETARDPGQTPQQLFARLKATTQKGANRMLRIEGILKVIAQDSHSPGRVQSAEGSVAKLRVQLIELQQSEAALEGQVSHTHTTLSSPSLPNHTHRIYDLHDCLPVLNRQSVRVLLKRTQRLTALCPMQLDGSHIRRHTTRIFVQCMCLKAAVLLSR